MKKRSPAKAVSKKKARLNEVERGLINNGKAMSDQQKKKWSKHDMRVIKPLTDPQQSLFTRYFENYFIIANGSAGTGKTLCALYLAFCDVLDPNTPQDRLIIVRSPVSTRDIGFMPGTAEEKTEMYQIPYIDLCEFLFGKASTYGDMVKAGIIVFMPTTNVRGVTWDDSVVVVDEIQNMNFHEINSVLTRLGENSKIIAVGDNIQSDLLKNSRDESGMKKFLNVASKVDAFEEIVFTKYDIIRSDFVKEWICALEDYNDNG